MEKQLTIFGMSGAFAFSALTGVLLHRLLPVYATGERRVGAGTPGADAR